VWIHATIQFRIFYDPVSYLKPKETWSLILRENLLKKMFGPKKEEVTGGWRKLQNEELGNFTLYTKHYLW